MKIDVNCDFTLDTPKYWDNFWENDSILGQSGGDPDVKSKMLQEYHRILWSRNLPNGEKMQLEKSTGSDYLRWNNFRFGSDSIFVSFRYKKYRFMLEEVAKHKFNYHQFIENYLHRVSTIAGHIIFPKGINSINQTRGCNPFISDRWDYTLECIRLFYKDYESPLFEVLQRNKDFFELFVDFEGYINYFFLQDFVTEDYTSVIMHDNGKVFRKNPRPENPQEYVSWIENQISLHDKRKERILKYCNSVK
ncbi:MAG: hypothetical protein II318_06925 [Bacteroidales bacterium]|nr:hypothetical protein [Bacteroidales bacterium]